MSTTPRPRSPLSLALSAFSAAFNQPIEQRIAPVIREQVLDLFDAWQRVNMLDAECATALKVDLHAYQQAASHAIAHAPKAAGWLPKDILVLAHALNAAQEYRTQRQYALRSGEIRDTASYDQQCLVIDLYAQIIQACMATDRERAQWVLMQLRQVADPVDRMQAERLYTAYFLAFPGFVSTLD